MKKIFPYISVGAGILIIGLYMYSTVQHREYIKKQEKLIVKEQQLAKTQVEEDKILWKDNSGNLIYKSVIKDSNLILTDIRTGAAEIISQIDSDNGDRYSNDDSFVFLINGDEAFILKDSKIVDQFSAVY